MLNLTPENKSKYTQAAVSGGLAAGAGAGVGVASAGAYEAIKARGRGDVTRKMTAEHLRNVDNIGRMRSTSLLDNMKSHGFRGGIRQSLDNRKAAKALAKRNRSLADATHTISGLAKTRVAKTLAAGGTLGAIGGLALYAKARSNQV